MEDDLMKGSGIDTGKKGKNGNCFRGKTCSVIGSTISRKTEAEGAVWRRGGTAGGALILVLIAAATARLIGLRDRRGGHSGLQAAKGKDRNKENNYGDYAKQR